MAAVASGLAAWLKADALFTSTVPGGVAWGARGVAADIQLPVDAKADARVEADRIASFMGSPAVKDSVEVIGRRRDLLGKSVTLKGDRLGYVAEGVAVFVIGVVETDFGTTVLTILRQLIPPPSSFAYALELEGFATAFSMEDGVSLIELESL